MGNSYERRSYVGMAIDPIHVGTGGAGFGSVDNTIVRDPVTRVPKIPGSSLAGVYRTYAAMAQQAQNRSQAQNPGQKNFFPDCAGLGQPRPDGSGGHCGQKDCPICTVFGFARGNAGGFAGLAAFSDAHVLLFPVATREGPVWITSPMAICQLDEKLHNEVPNLEGDVVYRSERGCKSEQAHEGEQRRKCLNLGWLLLEVKTCDRIERLKNTLKNTLEKYSICNCVLDNLGIVSDKLFPHVVNSNLEVRTSVAINPETGAAEEGALFSYEALPRATVLVWDVTCKNPGYFKIGNSDIEAVRDIQNIFQNVIEPAHPYFEYLGVGGMGTRGMGRLRVFSPKNQQQQSTAQTAEGGQ